MEELAGEKERRKCRQTKTTIILLDGIEACLDVSGGRWQTLCDDHGNVCSHQTLRLARYFMASPLDWCAKCKSQEVQEL